MKRYLLPLILMFLIFTSQAFSVEKIRIAIIDLKAKGVPERTASAVSDLIKTNMVRTNLFDVVEREQMNQIIAEIGFQQSGCTDQACAIQLGKLLSAKKILMGEVNKIGGAYIITIRIVDVEKGISEQSAYERADTEDALEDACKIITEKITEYIAYKTTEGYYSRAVVPGWGQFYAEKERSGYIYGGLFAVAAVYTGWAVYDFYDKKKAYEDQGKPQSEIDKKYKSARDAADMVNYSLIILGAVYIANWVDILFFSKPEFESKETAGKKTAGQSFILFDAVAYGMPYPDRKMTMGLGMRF